MLTSKQRAYLRGLANSMETILQVGKGGVIDTLMKQVDDALTARELIKLRVLETSPQSARETAEMCIRDRFKGYDDRLLILQGQYDEAEERYRRSEEELEALYSRMQQAAVKIDELQREIRTGDQQAADWESRRACLLYTSSGGYSGMEGAHGERTACPAVNHYEWGPDRLSQ